MIAIDINDLKEVIVLLERHHYSKASYHQLGLHLLLSHNTLKSIEQEYRGQVDRCFTECLASWLDKADGVETPTIDTLIAALRGIGKNAVADGITEERQSEICCFNVFSTWGLRPQVVPKIEFKPPRSIYIIYI